jgi:hypothetical protein
MAENATKAKKSGLFRVEISPITFKFINVFE